MDGVSASLFPLPAYEPLPGMARKPGDSSPSDGWVNLIIDVVNSVARSAANDGGGEAL